MGWTHRRRDHGGVIFVDLRDRTGLVQVVFNPEIAPESHQEAKKIRSEYVLAVRGTVRRRPPDMVNPNMETGEIEVMVGDVVFTKMLKPGDAPEAEFCACNLTGDVSVRAYCDLHGLWKG